MKKQWVVAGAVLLNAFGGWTFLQAEVVVTATDLGALEASVAKTDRETPATVAPQAAGVAQEAPVLEVDRLTQLEQRQAILEKKYEIDQEKAAAKAKETATVTANSKEGFSLKSPDGSHILKLSADLQADGRFFLNDGQDGAAGLTDTFLIRRARPTFDVSLYKWITGRFQPNFGQGTTTIDDAYLNLAFHPLAQFRTGRFKAPLGLENLKPSTRLTFIERALPTQLVPIFDQGVQVWGEPWDGRASYAVAVTNGAVDGTNVENTDSGDRKDFTARLFLKPYKKSDRAALAGLGVGLAGSTGRQGGTSTDSGLTKGYKTNAQNNFFTYLSGRAVAAGNRTRWSPQLTWNLGRIGVLSEYVASRQAVQSTATLKTADLTHRSWQVAASYVLTGEDVTEKGVAPRQAFQAGQPAWGAWEVAGRYSQFVADQETFSKVGNTENFASLTSSARVARAWTAGVNWYANSHLKIQANFEYTTFDGGAKNNGNRPTERAILTRVQLAY